MEYEPRPIIQDTQNRFFDPKPPEVPEQVFGFDSEQVIKLAKNAGCLMLYTPSTRASYLYLKHGYYIQLLAEDAVRVAPLIERVHAGEQLQPQDVRPYRKTIKRLIRKSGTIEGSRFGKVDRVGAALSVIGIGIPLRRRLNARVEKEFIARAPQLVEDAFGVAREHIDKLEPYVERISQYPNPQAEVRYEVYAVNHVIRAGARQFAHRRGSSVATSLDVAHAVQNEVNHAVQNPNKWYRHLPLISSFLPRKPITKPPVLPEDVLGVAAPEIVDFLDTLSPEDKRDPKFTREVRYYEHPKRWLALKFKGQQMRTLDRVTREFVPNLVSMIPERGEDVRGLFNRVKRVIGV